MYVLRNYSPAAQLLLPKLQYSKALTWPAADNDIFPPAGCSAAVQPNLKHYIQQRNEWNSAICHWSYLQSCRRPEAGVAVACRRDASEDRCCRARPLSSYRCSPSCPSSPSNPWTTASWHCPPACCRRASRKSAQTARCLGCSRSSWCTPTPPSGSRCTEPEARRTQATITFGSFPANTTRQELLQHSICNHHCC